MDYKRIFIENSLIFITVVTKDRKNILIDNISFLRKAFKLAKEKYKFEIIAIIVNPMKHYSIPPKEWKYSTFKKYVNKGLYELDWCNFDNKYGINEMNLE